MFSNGYRRYVLGTLTLVYGLNFVDRGLIVLLLQPIQADLQLTDTQLGFLTGLAFGLFYAVLGLPIARWADRGNRATITALAIGFWGITVMACLLVTNFVQLVCARIAAAVGEAGGMPPTYSLVGDYFPGSAERTQAMTFYMLAGPLSSLTSFALGGWLNERYGWRTTFFVMGIPALLIALLVKFTIREPRNPVHATAQVLRNAMPLRDVLLTLWRQRSSRHLIAGFILLAAIGFGLSPWYAAFLIRSHGFGTAELGVWLGLIFGIGGAVGISFGGYITGRWLANDEPTQMRLTAISVLLLVPCFALFLLLPQKLHALFALLALIMTMSFYAGPTFALMQRLVADEMRATTLAVVMLLANVVGMGMGPQIVGILSDALRPAFGTDSLRYSMMAVSFLAPWAAYHFWQVGRTVHEDLSR
jgi:predicted MFS family arabinose efflux permease